MTNYNEYMKSETWRKYRQKVLDKQKVTSLGPPKYICGNCKGVFTYLEVHHLTYERLGHEQIDDCIGLCFTCHPIADINRRYSARVYGLMNKCDMTYDEARDWIEQKEEREEWER